MVRNFVDGQRLRRASLVRLLDEATTLEYLDYYTELKRQAFQSLLGNFTRNTVNFRRELQARMF